MKHQTKKIPPLQGGTVSLLESLSQTITWAVDIAHPGKDELILAVIFTFEVFMFGTWVVSRVTVAPLALHMVISLICSCWTPVLVVKILRATIECFLMKDERKFACWWCLVIMLLDIAGLTIVYKERSAKIRVGGINQKYCYDKNFRLLLFIFYHLSLNTFFARCFILFMHLIFHLCQNR